MVLNHLSFRRPANELSNFATTTIEPKTFTLNEFNFKKGFEPQKLIKCHKETYTT